MRSTSLAVLGVLAVPCGCGPDEAVEAELDEICGEVGPFRVLELSDDELFAGRVQRVGERLYFVVGDAVTQADAPFSENPFGADIPMPLRPRVVSTGLCGEMPRAIADRVDAAYEDDRWPGAVLGRDDETGDVMLLDPLGVAPPRVFVPELPRIEVAPGVLLGSMTTEFGRAAVVPETPDATVGTLTLQPFPATIDDPPPAQVELLPDVSIEFGGFMIVGDQAFAVTGASVLLRLDLVDGSVESLVEGVRAFVVSKDTAFVAYQTTASSEGPWPTFLLERTTGIATWIGDSPIAGFGTNFFEDEVVVELDPETGFSSRLVEIPSLEVHDIPEDVSLWFGTSDGRHLAASNGAFILFDVETGERQLLFADYGPISFLPNALEVLDIQLLGAPDYYRRTGSLWRAPFEGGDPERVARRASPSHRHLPDERVVTPVDIDDAYLGDLVVVDPDSLEEQLIDTRVFANSVTPGVFEGVFEPGVVAYTIRDDERSGVWLAKPLP